MVPTWSTPRDQLPTWRGLMHAGAFAAVIPAAIVLVARAADGPARVAMAVYGASLVLAFGSSAAYHRLARTERAQRVLQRLDHSSIFALIAGSYTPMCIIALPRSWGAPLVAALWTVAVAGISLKVFGFHRFRTLGYVLYAVAAGVAAVGLPQLWHEVSATQFFLLLLGGVLYVAGVPVLRWGPAEPLAADVRLPRGVARVHRRCRCVAAGGDRPVRALSASALPASDLPCSCP